MRKHLQYFWVNPEVVVHEFCPENLRGCECVDVEAVGIHYRYGKYLDPHDDDTIGDSSSWEHIPYDQLNPTFRAMLLIMGIK
jgi:hypothetical protein